MSSPLSPPHGGGGASLVPLTIRNQWEITGAKGAEEKFQLGHTRNGSLGVVFAPPPPPPMK